MKKIVSKLKFLLFVLILHHVKTIINQMKSIYIVKDIMRLMSYSTKIYKTN